MTTRQTSILLWRRTEVIHVHHELSLKLVNGMVSFSSLLFFWARRIAWRRTSRMRLSQAFDTSRSRAFSIGNRSVMNAIDGTCAKTKQNETTKWWMEEVQHLVTTQPSTICCNQNRKWSRYLKFLCCLQLHQFSDRQTLHTALVPDVICAAKNEGQSGWISCTVSTIAQKLRVLLIQSQSRHHRVAAKSWKRVFPNSSVPAMQDDCLPSVKCDEQSTPAWLCQLSIYIPCTEPRQQE